MSALGLPRGQVVLVAHSPEWARLFEAEKTFLLSIGRTVFRAVEHIGSTAVPGLAAKPIIDIAAGVRSLKDAAVLHQPLEEVGYHHRADALSDQFLYVKGPESHRTHHLHIVEFGGPIWRGYLVFRDHLRSHPEDAATYATLKRELAQRYAQNRQAYTAEKAKYVEALLTCALR